MGVGNHYEAAFVFLQLIIHQGVLILGESKRIENEVLTLPGIVNIEP